MNLPSFQYDRTLLYRSLATSDTFRIYVGETVAPLSTLHKSVVEPDTKILKRMATSRTGVTNRKMHGYASNQMQDRHRETLIQEGLDFTELIQCGWINDNHIQTSAAIMGFPTCVELHQHKDKGVRWYIQGYLLEGEGLPDVDKVWATAKALHALDRKLGLSVEGKVTERQGSVIRRAIIRNMAITPYPVNIYCPWDLFIDAMENTPEYQKALSEDNPHTSIGGGGVLMATDKDTPLRSPFRCETTGMEFESEAELKAYQKGLGIGKGCNSPLDKSSAIGWIMGAYPDVTRGLAEEVWALVTSDAWRIYLDIGSIK